MPRWPGMRIRKTLCGHEAGNGGYRQGEAPKFGLCQKTTGGQGVHREMESEGYAEKYRAVVEGAILRRTGRPKVGQGRACTMEAKAFSFTHRTKVFADGTVWKISA